MRLWAVTMVRDEIDIIERTLRHVVSEGVEGIIVADNLSTDGTYEWLCDNVDNLGCQVAVQRDEDPAYDQSRKMTSLTHQAFAVGADWVWPLDADEIWFNGNQELTVAQTLSQVSTRVDGVRVRLFNHFPTSADDPSEHNPIRRITRRDANGAPLRKVMVRNRPDVVIHQGNHSAAWDGVSNELGTDIQISHFPWRSFDQWARKVENGYAAYMAMGDRVPADMGTHWRGYGEILKSRGLDALRDVWDTWFFDPPVQLEELPAPWCRFGGNPQKL